MLGIVRVLVVMVSSILCCMRMKVSALLDAYNKTAINKPALDIFAAVVAARA